jgi:hypothetical protein
LPGRIDVYRPFDQLPVGRVFAQTQIGNTPDHDKDDQDHNHLKKTFAQTRRLAVAEYIAVTISSQ